MIRHSANGSSPIRRPYRVDVLSISEQGRHLDRGLTDGIGRKVPVVRAFGKIGRDSGRRQAREVGMFGLNRMASAVSTIGIAVGVQPFGWKIRRKPVLQAQFLGLPEHDDLEGEAAFTESDRDWQVMSCVSRRGCRSFRCEKTHLLTGTGGFSRFRVAGFGLGVLVEVSDS